MASPSPVFRYLQVIDSRLLTLNLAWLLMIILNPFATKLLTTRGHETMGVHALRWGFYALLQLLASAVVLAMVHHMISHHLQAPGTPPLNVTESDWQSYGLMLGFGLSIPVFFFINYAWLLWGVVPLLVGPGTSALAPKPPRPRGHLANIPRTGPPPGRCFLRPSQRRNGHGTRREQTGHPASDAMSVAH